MRLILNSIIIIILAATPCFSFTEQSTTERIIKENRSFIDFLNISITNFGDQSKIDTFKKIYAEHFNGFVAYLQSDYKRAFTRIYDSQAEQEKLFVDMVKNLYLEDAKDILDELAPMIVRSKNAKARLYLTLGYRERTVGRNDYVIGTASNPKLHSYKIYEYIKAVKRARRAKRYGFLALFEGQTNETKLKIYNHLFEQENAAGNPFFKRFMGKSGEAYMDEMNRPYSDVKENEKNDAAALKVNASGDAASDAAVKESPAGSYESQIQKRARFRNEAKLAKLLLFSEFERADDFLRDYVEDLNFKIITASFDVVSAEKKDSEDKIDYTRYKLHHIDNYSRLYNKSAIEGFVDDLKVQDNIKEEPADAGAKSKSAETKITDKTENVIDKKDTADKQDRTVPAKKGENSAQ